MGGQEVNWKEGFTAGFVVIPLASGIAEDLTPVLFFL